MKELFFVFPLRCIHFMPFTYHHHCFYPNISNLSNYYRSIYERKLFNTDKFANKFPGASTRLTRNRNIINMYKCVERLITNGNNRSFRG